MGQNTDKKWLHQNVDPWVEQGTLSNLVVKMQRAAAIRITSFYIPG